METIQGPAVTDLAVCGRGVERPEQVVVDRDGRVYCSDKGSAVAEILPSGAIRRLGRAGGDPNGISLTEDGRFLIANFGTGMLQELDPATEQIRVLLEGDLEGLPLTWLNFVLVDAQGGLWASVCSANPDLVHTIAYGTADGFLVHAEAGGARARVVATGVNFPNCMALDREGQFLYVVRTLTADVVRYPVVGDSLGEEEVYSPPLGGRRPDEYGEEQKAAFLSEPDVARRWGMADGCGFDGDGNLWVTLATGNRVVAVTPDRRVVPVLDDSMVDLLQGPTSVAWGGPDLRDIFIGSLSARYVLKGRCSVAGMPMVHQR